MNHKKWTFMDRCTLRLSMGWVKIWKKLLPRITHGTSSLQELLAELKTNKQKRTTENSGQISSILNFRCLGKKFFCNFMVFQINCQLIGGCMLLIVIARQLFLNRFSPLMYTHVPMTCNKIVEILMTWIFFWRSGHWGIFACLTLVFISTQHSENSICT